MTQSLNHIKANMVSLGIPYQWKDIFAEQHLLVHMNCQHREL